MNLLEATMRRALDHICNAIDVLGGEEGGYGANPRDMDREWWAWNTNYNLSRSAKGGKIRSAILAKNNLNISSGTTALLK